MALVKSDVFHRIGATKPIPLKLFSNGVAINLTYVSKVEIKLKNRKSREEISFNSVDNSEVLAIADPPTDGIVNLIPSSDSFFSTIATYDYYVEITDSGGISSVPQNSQCKFKVDDWF